MPSRSALRHAVAVADPRAGVRIDQRRAPPRRDLRGRRVRHARLRPPAPPRRRRAVRSCPFATRIGAAKTTDLDATFPGTGESRAARGRGRRRAFAGDAVRTSPTRCAISCLVAHHRRRGLALATTYLPSAILLDVRLPDGSGLSGAARCSRTTRARATFRCTSSPLWRTWPTSRLHMGAVGYAVKPTSRDAAASEVFAAPRGQVLAKKIKRVLVVEDDARQRDSVVHLIKEDDIEIAAVETGAEAAGPAQGHGLRLHDHRPEAARHGRQRAAGAHDDGGHLLVPAGDRLHGPQPHARGGAEAQQVFALHHHQGRALARAPARRGDAVPAQGGVAAVGRAPEHAAHRAQPREACSRAARCCWSTTTCATSSR